MNLLNKQKMQRVAKQHGAALIFMTFILLLGVAAFVLKVANTSSLVLEKAEITNQSLSEAKTALIAWAVSNNSSPGEMPWPDRNTDTDFEGGSAYDGKSDCVTTAFQYSYLLGQLPIYGQTNPCVTPHIGLGGNYRDADGNRLWYAVSRNLVYDYENSEHPVINPGMINSPYTGSPYLRQGGTTAYRWLTVYKVKSDGTTTLLSDRVAAVIIAPGQALSGQDRDGAADAIHYLDSITVGGSTYSNRGYATADEDFFIVDDNSIASTFNDKLVYITIDELMEAVEKRVAADVRSTLLTYKTSYGFFPYAAALGSTISPNVCVQNNLQGLLPINPSINYTCSCTSSPRTCSCSFSAISSVTFIRSNGSYGTSGTRAPTGACTVPSSNQCKCTGAGTCKQNSATAPTRFSCDACGVCTSTVNGRFSFVTTAAFSAPSPTTGCTTMTSTNINCSYTPSRTFNINACTDSPLPLSPSVGGLPAWFTSNIWEDYIYYAVSNNCTSGGTNCATATPQLTVGTKAGVQSILISTGKPIAPGVSPFVASKGSNQSRTSCDIKDYLDSAENTNATLVNGSADLVYDSKNINRTAIYNDQTVIVAP